jgi:predicted  nucleic acid-binding Zn-ribbon protein
MHREIKVVNREIRVTEVQPDAASGKSHYTMAFTIDEAEQLIKDVEKALVTAKRAEKQMLEVALRSAERELKATRDKQTALKRQIRRLRAESAGASHA